MSHRATKNRATRLFLILPLALLVSAGAAAGGELQGRIDTFTLKGSASEMEAEVKVYLPPGYADAKGSFPVLYFLHGSGGVGGIDILAQYAERAVGEKLCPPFLIVEPRGPQTPECGWVDDKFGKSLAATLVSRDLVAAVDSRYRTLANREARVIAGFSMGGFGAMAQLFQHPELFATGVAYDGGFHAEKDIQNAEERIRKRWERLFGDDTAALQAATPQGRAAQYAYLPADKRLPVDYQLLIGAFRERIESFQRELEELGVGLPDRVIGKPTQHNLGLVLENAWREHFRFLGERLATAVAPAVGGPDSTDAARTGPRSTR